MLTTIELVLVMQCFKKVSRPNQRENNELGPPLNLFAIYGVL